MGLMLRRRSARRTLANDYGAVLLGPQYETACKLLIFKMLELTVNGCFYPEDIHGFARLSLMKVGFFFVSIVIVKTKKPEKLIE